MPERRAQQSRRYAERVGRVSLLILTRIGLFGFGIDGSTFGGAFAARAAFWPCVRYHDPAHWDCAAMDWSDYLRDQAAKYRQLAEEAEDPARSARRSPITSKII